MAMQKGSPKSEKTTQELTLPFSLESEQSVIGGLLIKNDRWDDVVEIVKSDDFYHYVHRAIFKEMENLVAANIPIDVITVHQAFESKGMTEQISFAYLTDLVKNTPSVANIATYAKIISEYAVRRELITAGSELISLSQNPNGLSLKEVLDTAERRVFDINESRQKSDQGPRSSNSILMDTVARIEAISNSKNHNSVTGLDTGFEDLNQLTSGLQSSDLIIVAARPSMGKTTFAMNICENVARQTYFDHDDLDETGNPKEKLNKPVLVFSLEMPSDQIMMRMLSSLSGVEQTKIRDGKLESDDDWAKFAQAMSELSERNNIWIDDTANITPTELRSRARRMYKEHGGLSLIMIDYLQLMRAPGFANNRTLEIAEISRSLKTLAKELNIPIIVLSQLNRNLEQRSNKRPVNSDLRESGSIEQDADVIMFIYRDEVYNDVGPEDKGVAEVIIGKQRNGPIGKIFMTFQGKYSRFVNYAGPPRHTLD